MFYGIDNAAIDTLAPALAEDGWAVCEIEYRRVGEDGGGWPGTNDDILAALDSLNDVSAQYSLDMSKVALVGHSAGGCLAMWACSSRVDRPMSFKPKVCVAVAPVGDLVSAQNRRLSTSGNAVQAYLNGSLPGDEADVKGNIYSMASPSSLLPLIVPSIIVAGSDDADVPMDYVQQVYDTVTSHHSYTESSNNAAVSLLVAKDTDHYQLMNAASDAWKLIMATIVAAL